MAIAANGGAKSKSACSGCKNRLRALLALLQRSIPVGSEVFVLQKSLSTRSAQRRFGAKTSKKDDKNTVQESRDSTSGAFYAMR